MKGFLHSVRLIEENCNGCTRCMTKCPTEAVRLKNSRAVIYNERCIDCGECIKVCHNNAHVADKGNLEDIFGYKYKIAIPSVTLYSQFGEFLNPYSINEGLIDIGFSEVFDITYACDIVSEIIKSEIEGVAKPVISPFCPSVLRLIQNMYPELIKHLPRTLTPIEVAARLIREKYSNLGCNDEEVGIFYLSPCVSWITDIRYPRYVNSGINDAIPISDIYPLILKSITKTRDSKTDSRCMSRTGLSWSAYGGQSTSMGIDEYITVGGVENLIKVFDEIEKGKMKDVEFVEAFACSGGCLGGIFLIDNPFNTERISKKLVNSMNFTYKINEIGDELRNKFPQKYIDGGSFNEKLASDFKEAVQRMKLMNRLLNLLPGKDCGQCGSPSCKAFAEDVARGLSDIEECKMISKGVIISED